MSPKKYPEIFNQLNQELDVYLEKNGAVMPYRNASARGVKDAENQTFPKSYR